MAVITSILAQSARRHQGGKRRSGVPYSSREAAGVFTIRRDDEATCGPGRPALSSSPTIRRVSMNAHELMLAAAAGAVSLAISAVLWAFAQRRAADRRVGEQRSRNRQAEGATEI